MRTLAARTEPSALNIQRGFHERVLFSRVKKTSFIVHILPTQYVIVSSRLVLKASLLVAPELSSCVFHSMKAVRNL